MSLELWSAVDTYLDSSLGINTPVLEQIIRNCEAAALPAIAVSPAQGKQLMILAKAVKAQRILEIGTLGGYSATWLAWGLPADGKLVTLEVAERHAVCAQNNLELAKVADKVEIRLGPASETLEKMIESGEEPFDLVFIDADKETYPTYLELCLKLVKPGSVMIADNVVRDGEVSNASSGDERVQGAQQFVTLLGKQPKLDSTVIQTVGAKGYDGFSISFVN